MRKSVMIEIAALALALTFASAPSWAAGNAAGKKVFLDNKCNKCHAMKSEGISALPKEAGADEAEAGGAAKKDPPDLSKIDAAFLKTKATPEDSLKAWLKKEVDVNGAKHKKLFNGADADLASLVSFLLGK
ncbi:MAG: c-type cytochrome [Deltaproteobacteria bacterium]|nr:c-type cytochrome [Deltaproteobacteria bacterium]